MNIFRAFKLCSFIFVASIAMLPYLSLLSHTVSHSLYAFEHHHAHGEQAAVRHVCGQEQDRDHSHDHDIAVDTYPIARITSLIKVKLLASASCLIFLLPRTVIIDRLSAITAQAGTSCRLPIEHFVALSLYPINAPPLR
jgi:hypothetical protein